LRDAALITAASSDADIVRFIDITTNITGHDTSAWIERRLDGWTRGWRVPLAIEAGDGAVGYVNLRIDWDRSIGEIGYWLLTSSRGRGLMADAVRAITSWAFDALGLARVQATVQPANDASLRTLELAGFTREGLLRSSDVGARSAASSIAVWVMAARQVRHRRADATGDQRAPTVSWRPAIRVSTLVDRTLRATGGDLAGACGPTRRRRRRRGRRS
jgi:ribosomal-protein-alanine N-acetyltransferase